MRVITINAPRGASEQIAVLGFSIGLDSISVAQTTQRSKKGTRACDHVEIMTNAPSAKKFIEALLESDFYDPEAFSFSIRDSQSLFSGRPPKAETKPFVIPTTDVYEDLHQFTEITGSLVVRVFLASVLVAVGLLENSLAILIAGLLFLPFHHHLVGLSLGLVIKEWKFFSQAVAALLLSLVLIVGAGAIVGSFAEAPVQYDKFGSLSAGVVLAGAIGIAAALATADDAGRKELIGLAATAHISVYPAWLGLQIGLGFPNAETVSEHMAAFGLNAGTFIALASVTYMLIRMQGAGIRRFVEATTSRFSKGGR